jgi:hypothetical protein
MIRLSVEWSGDIGCGCGGSRYDNVIAQDYPNILITAGLHDPRVAYWEPAKWASKLRTLKTDSNEVGYSSCAIVSLLCPGQDSRHILTHPLPR